MMTFSPHAQTSAEVLRGLGSRVEGLTGEEVRERLERYGENRFVEQKKTNWAFILLRQINTTMVYVLLVASVISFFLADRVDAGVILLAVVLNVGVGFIQELKAESSLVQLKKMLAPMTMVLRDGQEKVVPSQLLVPGDVVLLNAGDAISMDGRVLKSDECEVMESNLTGEAEPVAKAEPVLKLKTALGDQTNMVFAGTTVMNGSARVVVTSTGGGTELGKIAVELGKAEERPTPLQKQLNRFSRTLAGVIGILTLILFLIGMAFGRPFLDMFTLAIAVAVSALPEGLIIGVTVILAIGMKRILQRKGLVRRLASAETLGAVTVICTDKTGTLTEGKMRVDRVVTWDHSLRVHREHPEKELSELFLLVTIGLLNNDTHIINPDDEIEHWNITGNLTERALVFAGATLGLNYKKIQAQNKRLHAIPFNSTDKIMMTLHKGANGKTQLYVKGAPEKVLDLCQKIRVATKGVQLTPTHRKRLLSDFATMSKQGLRVLGLAYAEIAHAPQTITPDLFAQVVFAGFVGIKDGLRAEAPAAVVACQQAGIQVKMITGDHKYTATSIAKELSLVSSVNQVIDGIELAELSDSELTDRIHDITVFARVSPQDKLRVVEALQHAGEVVAMTGDGVNDAPALKAADIGVALGSGTSVAKDAADLIILDDNFQTIVAAVQEGRIIFDNIKKSVLYLISSSFSEIILISASIFFNLPLPLSAAQILWINLVTDTFPNLALTLEPQEVDVMHEAPRSSKTRIIDRNMLFFTGIVSGLTGLMHLGLFFVIWKTTQQLTLARTITFLSLSISTLLVAFSVKSLRKSVWKSNPFNNQALTFAVLGGAGLIMLSTVLRPLQLLLHTTALDWRAWTLVGGVAMLLFILIELSKIRLIKSRSL